MAGQPGDVLENGSRLKGATAVQQMFSTSIMPIDRRSPTGGGVQILVWSRRHRRWHLLSAFPSAEMIVEHDFTHWIVCPSEPPTQ